MQIKKYIAATLKEASLIMKEELGGDAVILGTRIIEGDDRFKKKRMFEITAGIENGLDKVSKSGKRAKLSTDDNSSGDYFAELKNLNEKIYKNPSFAKIGVKKECPAQTKKSNTSLNTELKEIGETLQFREIQKPVINAIVERLKKYKSFLTRENIDSYLISSIATMIPTRT